MQRDIIIRYIQGRTESKVIIGLPKGSRRVLSSRHGCDHNGDAPMMVRLDFTGRAKGAARALRIAQAPSRGVAVVAEAGPRLPFGDGCIDEVFVGRAVAWRSDIAETLDELWRVGKPGALIHLTLPHASSTLALSRDARPRPLLTLNTFNYYDPRTKPADAPTTAFTIATQRRRLSAQHPFPSSCCAARPRSRHSARNG